MIDRAAPAGTRQWDVVGVGDIDVDMFLEVPVLAGRDDKVPARLVGEHPGGMIANVTCAASALGASTAMVGRVGTDPYGAVARQGLRDFGVDDSLVTVIPGGRTFYCVIMLDESGEKALTAVLTDCHWPSRDDIDPDWFGRTRTVHLAGDDLDLACWVASEARRRGAAVSLDLEASTAAHGLDRLGPLLASTDVVFMNHAGARLFGTDPLSAVRTALQHGPLTAVVTQGARGVLAAAGREVVAVPAMPGPVVDTTGAGDCFIGSFLTRALAGDQLEVCTRFAAAAASSSIRTVGSRTSLPSAADVDRLLRDASISTTPEGAR